MATQETGESDTLINGNSTTEKALEAANELISTLDHAFAEMTNIVEACAEQVKRQDEQEAEEEEEEEEKVKKLSGTNNSSCDGERLERDLFNAATAVEEDETNSSNDSSSQSHQCDAVESSSSSPALLHENAALHGIQIGKDAASLEVSTLNVDNNDDTISTIDFDKSPPPNKALYSVEEEKVSQEAPPMSPLAETELSQGENKECCDNGDDEDVVPVNSWKDDWDWEDDLDITQVPSNPDRTAEVLDGMGAESMEEHTMEEDSCDGDSKDESIAYPQDRLVNHENAMPCETIGKDEIAELNTALSCEEEDKVKENMLEIAVSGENNTEIEEVMVEDEKISEAYRESNDRVPETVVEETKEKIVEPGDEKTSESCEESNSAESVDDPKEIDSIESDDNEISDAKDKKSKVNDLSFHQKEKIRSEKIAQSQAEDLLDLTLELQQLKEAFQIKENEFMKVSQDLEAERLRSSSLTGEIEQQKLEIDKMKNKHADEIGKLSAELGNAQSIAKAAEEDAQEGLELAKENDEKRREMETLLTRALDEMDFLRNQAKALPMITEEHHEIEPKKSSLSMSEREEDNSIPSYINQVDSVRLSTGRNLLRQAAGSSCDNDDISSASSTQDGSMSSRTSNSSYLLDLTRKAAEKRRKLRSRLNKGEESKSLGGSDVVCYSSPSTDGMDLAFVGALNKTCKSLMTLMTKSGKNLNLGGRWFNSSSSAASLKSRGKKGTVDTSELEPMAKSYCKSVEAVISRQKEQVNELRSFCEYLERKVANQRDDTTRL